MKINSLDKVLLFELDSNRPIKPKYNKPIDNKDNSLQIGINNYLSKQHRQRTMKVLENKIKIKSNLIMSINSNNIRK